MEANIEFEYVSNANSNYKLGSKKRKKNLKLGKGLMIIFYIVIIIIIIFVINKYKLFQIKQRNEIYNRISNLKTKNYNLQQQLNQANEMIIKLYNKISINNQYIIFTQEINQKYKEEQNFFCDNILFFINNEFENQIQKSKIKFYGKIYDMFIYSDSDNVSRSIMKAKSWEGGCTLKILKALNFYTNKTNSKNEDLYILDIGGNVGWYSFYLGKYDYNIMSFEPTERNFYILKKNYCLNRDINITIINKGLFTSEKECDYYENIGNKGNGMVLCHQRNDIPSFLQKKSVVILTKLKNFIPFLSEKKVAFMKIDVEGAEKDVILGGIELISKYHVPFIFLEFSPGLLKLHDSNNRNFLEIFENNGYKISISNFLDKNYVSIDYLLKTKGIFNLYIIYTKILE